MAQRFSSGTQAIRNLEKRLREWLLSKRVYFFSIAGAITNGHKLVAKTIPCYYLLVLEVRGRSWVLLTKINASAGLCSFLAI